MTPDIYGLFHCISNFIMCVYLFRLYALKTPYQHMTGIQVLVSLGKVKGKDQEDTRARRTAQSKISSVTWLAWK